MTAQHHAQSAAEARWNITASVKREVIGKHERWKTLENYSMHSALLDGKMHGLGMPRFSNGFGGLALNMQ